MKPEVKLVALTLPASFYINEHDKVPFIPELDEPLEVVEYAGRWDYGPKSIAKLGEKGILRRWIEAGHESMMEMVDATFLITCSRVVSHELVRHRAGTSFQQESQRFVKYEDESFEDIFYMPPELNGFERPLVEEAYRQAFDAYKRLRKLYTQPQLARYVLPNGTRTRVVMKANLREWRHILRLRMHSSAQPEMQEVAAQLYDILHYLFAPVFSDIDGAERAPR